jgi:hypothetical protein
MSVRPSLAELAGSWKGNYRLHTSRLPQTTHDSESKCNVDLRVNGQFLAIEYDWVYEDKRQEGVLIVGCDEASDAVQAIWSDSWHMSHKFMICDGTIDDGGKVNMIGSYSAPEGPEWGWRIELAPEKDSLRIKMFNISPEGDEEIAVESNYSRE